MGKRVDSVWKEEGQGGGKDSPQVDTIAKSHQVQVSRCLHASKKGDRGEEVGWARVRGGEEQGRGDASERDIGLPRNYSARRTRGSSQVILALGCRVIYPALLLYLPPVSERTRPNEGQRKEDRERERGRERERQRDFSPCPANVSYLSANTCS